MGNEFGTWVLYGVDWDESECIHTVEEPTEYINKIGFLPLFKNDIPGVPVFIAPLNDCGCQTTRLVI